MYERGKGVRRIALCTLYEREREMEREKKGGGEKRSEERRRGGGGSMHPFSMYVRRSRKEEEKGGEGVEGQSILYL